MGQIPQRNDGFDVNPNIEAVPSTGISSTDIGNMKLDTLRNFSIAEIANALAVDEEKARVIKGIIVALPAAVLAGITIDAFGKYIGDKWAGLLGGGLGGLIGGMIVGNVIPDVRKFRSKRSKTNYRR